MAKMDRMVLVLEVLGKSDLALPPKAIWINLRLRGATFEYRTLTNYLRELTNEGYVEKLAEHEGYYQITNEGRRFLLANT